MDHAREDFLPALRMRLAARCLPRWDELPDFDLYMDQVLAYISKYLGGSSTREEAKLTASMVNNYVKKNVMPSPVKKKYARTHLAHLIIICVLKAAFPIDFIRRYLENGMPPSEEIAFYNRFCQLFEQTNGSVAESASLASAAGGPEEELNHIALHAALRAQAEQALAMEAISLLLAAEGKAESKEDKMSKKNGNSKEKTAK